MGTNPGEIDGRMVGKTNYYTASADGTLYYPANHVTNFTDRYNELMYEGTQNVGGRRLQVIEWTDLSTASFYRVLIGIESNTNEAVINQRNLEIDKDGNIK